MFHSTGIKKLEQFRIRYLMETGYSYCPYIVNTNVRQRDLKVPYREKKSPILGASKSDM